MASMAPPLLDAEESHGREGFLHLQRRFLHLKNALGLEGSHEARERAIHRRRDPVLVDVRQQWKS